MDRICSRRVCKDCKTVYNVKTHPETSCDSCGGELITRADDNEKPYPHVTEFIWSRLSHL